MCSVLVNMYVRAIDEDWMRLRNPARWKYSDFAQISFKLKLLISALTLQLV